MIFQGVYIVLSSKIFKIKNFKKLIAANFLKFAIYFYCILEMHVRKITGYVMANYTLRFKSNKYANQVN